MRTRVRNFAKIALKYYLSGLSARKFCHFEWRPRSYRLFQQYYLFSAVSFPNYEQVTTIAYFRFYLNEIYVNVFSNGRSMTLVNEVLTLAVQTKKWSESSKGM